MSFLDKLQDIGFGNRGPGGRMQSGAQRLSDVLQEKVSSETGRGVNKAIIAASKDGMIDPKKQMEISERWNVPLPQIMKMVKPMNDKAEGTRLKNMGQSFYQQVRTRKKEFPDEKQIPEKILQQFAENAGAKTGEESSFLVYAVQKMQPKPKDKVLKPGDIWYESVGGKVNELARGDTKPEPKKTVNEKWAAAITGAGVSVEAFTDGTMTADDATKIVKKYHEFFPGSKPTGAKDKTQEQMASDIRSQAQQLTGLRAGVDLMKEVMATEVHTKALKEAKTQLLVMIKEYEERFGVASARTIGFDTTLSKPVKPTMTDAQGYEYLEKAGGDIEKAREMARKDGLNF